MQPNGNEDVLVTPAQPEYPAPRDAIRPPRRPGMRVPLVLFALTCLSTYLAWGPVYCVAIMTTLVAHEFGHYLQARRYRVPASYPYFLPMPFSPLGTLGAVIAMHPGMGNRRSLFDIAVSGPLAGLVPTLVFSIWGLWLSEVKLVQENPGGLPLGDPLLYRWLAAAILGPVPAGHDIFLHPLAYAGWVGMFITALNLIPIGQLDGGHLLYALLLQRSHTIATGLLLCAAGAVIVFGYWGWTLMILLLLMIGPKHPPTANDSMDLGLGRTILGWLAIAFVVVGFTPTPFWPPA